MKVISYMSPIYYCILYWQFIIVRMVMTHSQVKVILALSYIWKMHHKLP